MEHHEAPPPGQSTCSVCCAYRLVPKHVVGAMQAYLRGCSCWCWHVRVKHAGALQLTCPASQEHIEAENGRLEREQQFWAKEIIIKIEYKFCPNLTIIDTPGEHWHSTPGWQSVMDRPLPCPSGTGKTSVGGRRFARHDCAWQPWEGLSGSFEGSSGTTLGAILRMMHALLLSRTSCRTEADRGMP